MGEPGGAMARYEVSDELWARIQPLLPLKPRRSRWPGRLPLDDRACLNGILFVLLTGIRWTDLPQQLGYGSGMTCWRRLRAWTQAGVWDQLHALLLAELHAGDQIGWTRAAVDASHAGMASAVHNAMRQLGQVLGVAVLGALVYAHLGTNQVTERRLDPSQGLLFVDGLHAALWVSGLALLASALLAALLLARRAPRPYLPSRAARSSR